MSLPIDARAFVLRNLDDEPHTVMVTRGGETINVHLERWDVWSTYGSTVNLKLGEHVHTQIDDEQEWIIQGGRLYKQFISGVRGR